MFNDGLTQSFHDVSSTGKYISKVGSSVDGGLVGSLRFRKLVDSAFSIQDKGGILLTDQRSGQPTTLFCFPQPRSTSDAHVSPGHH